MPQPRVFCASWALLFWLTACYGNAQSDAYGRSTESTSSTGSSVTVDSAPTTGATGSGGATTGTTVAATTGGNVTVTTTGTTSTTTGTGGSTTTGTGGSTTTGTGGSTTTGTGGSTTSTGGSTTSASAVVVEDFHDAYASGGNNTLGYSHTDNGAFQTVTARGNILTLVTMSGSPNATWTTNLAQAQQCMDTSEILSANFTLRAPTGSVIALRITTVNVGCVGVASTQDFYVPATSIDGTTRNVAVPFSHYGISIVTNVKSIAFTNLSPSTAYEIGPITLTPGLDAQSTVAPTTGTTLDLPDPHFGKGDGSGGAQWAYDKGSICGTEGEPTDSYAASNPAWETIQTYVTPGEDQWTGALRVTDRPYAVSGASDGTANNGDKFKICSLQRFGVGTYTWRVYLPLNVSSTGGERNSTAAWIFDETSQASIPPEVDIECGYSDAGTPSSVRGSVNANANQTVCHLTVQDGSDSGAGATAMALQGDAWHILQIVLSDDGKGYFNVVFKIDGNTASWPATVSTHAGYLDTGELSSASNTTTGGYNVSTIQFNAVYSMEHLHWMGAQNALTYNTSYVDWFNFQP